MADMMGDKLVPSGLRTSNTGLLSPYWSIHSPWPARATPQGQSCTERQERQSQLFSYSSSIWENGRNVIGPIRLFLIFCYLYLAPAVDASAVLFRTLLFGVLESGLESKVALNFSLLTLRGAANQETVSLWSRGWTWGQHQEPKVDS